MKVSIIIPTHNRLKILQKCLKAISAQDFPKDEMEVLVIDDGSIDGTEKLKEDLFQDNPYPSRYYYQTQRGPSAARNNAINEAKGDILIFIGDDIIIGENFVKTHFTHHDMEKNKNTVIIGKTVWDTTLSLTPFMYHLENGIQFDFNNLTNDNVSFRHCYTSNISVNRNYILNNSLLFSEEFPYAAFEDIEWGYRLKKKDVVFRYDPTALAYHHHPVDFENYSKRMIYSGRALAHLLKLHPDIPFSGRIPKTGLALKELLIRAKIRQFILQIPYMMEIMHKAKPKSLLRWIKIILGYYEEKGFTEEHEKIFH